MKVDVEVWKVSDFIKIKDKINEQPPYQRGEVWTSSKKKHLIDSILRGIDIPKIYLRKLNTGPYEYEVADGQQRLTSILKYLEGSFRLDNKQVNGLDLSKINGYNIGSKKFSELDPSLQNAIKEYELTIAIVNDATNDEIRTLFGRLQLGSSLTPAEKRNAIISTLGNHINNYAVNHSFFKSSIIPVSRYRRQDYLAHGIALVKFNNLYPLKADLLNTLYLTRTISLNAQDLQNIANILDCLCELDTELTTGIYNKFTFIDFFWFFYRKLGSFSSVDYPLIVTSFNRLETDRLHYHKVGSDVLLTAGHSTYNQDLYDYIDAFHNDGSDPSKIATRARIFDSLFSNFLR